MTIASPARLSTFARWISRDPRLEILVLTLTFWYLLSVFLCCREGFGVIRGLGLSGLGFGFRSCFGSRLFFSEHEKRFGKQFLLQKSSTFGKSGFQKAQIFQKSHFQKADQKSKNNQKFRPLISANTRILCRQCWNGIYRLRFSRLFCFFVEVVVLADFCVGFCVSLLRVSFFFVPIYRFLGSFCVSVSNNNVKKTEK